MKTKNKSLLGTIFFLICLVFLLTSCDLLIPKFTEDTIIEDKITESSYSDFNLTDELNKLKVKILSPPVVTSHVPYQEIDSGYERELVIIEGKSAPQTQIEIKVNGKLLYKKYLADAAGYFKTDEGIEIVEGSNTVELYSIVSGERSEPTRLIFILNVTKSLDYKIFKDLTTLSEINDVYYTKEYEPFIFIIGTALPESEIFLRVNNIIVSQTISDEQGIFNFNDIKISGGENFISVWSSNNNESTIMPTNRNLLVVRDTGSPEPSSLVGHVANDGNHLAWAAADDYQFVTYKLIRVDEPCKNPQYPTDHIIATINDSRTTSFIDKDVVEGKAYFYTLWTLDKAGNLISSNILSLPAPQYYLSMRRLGPLQSEVISRRQWFTQYYEITNTGNVPLNIQPLLIWFKLNPDPDPQTARNPLWAVYIWDPQTGVNYYLNEDIREDRVIDWKNAPEKIGTMITGLEPGDKIKIAVKVVNIAANNGDEIIVHFHFAPADCSGYFFIEDSASTLDIFIASSGK